MGSEVVVEIRRRSHVKPSRLVVLKLLKAELQFLESGGYRRSARSPWRPPYVFEESPSCPNFSDRSRPHRCDDCWLMDFVSPDSLEEQVPCRFVQLTPDGITIDSLYRYGTSAETEAILGAWLRARIQELEEEIAPGSNLPFAANS
jgi:hypothetical protein